MGTNSYQKPGGTVVRRDPTSRRGGISLPCLHYPLCLTLSHGAFPVFLTILDFSRYSTSMFDNLSSLGELTLTHLIQGPNEPKLVGNNTERGVNKYYQILFNIPSRFII